MCRPFHNKLFFIGKEAQSIFMKAIMILVILLAIYLIMIMPRMKGRPDFSPLFRKKCENRTSGVITSGERKKISCPADMLYYAHRGLHDNESEAPENSMKAFQKAIDAGYGIELDVQLTRDRIPVVFHDASLQRVCGVPGNVRDYTYEELKKFPLCRSNEHIPLFADFLKLVDGRVPLIIEIKIHENADTVCSIVDELIRDYRGAYCIESFHPFAVRWYKKHRPEVIRGQLSGNMVKPGQPEALEKKLVHYLLTNFVAKPDFVAYDHRNKNNISRLICRKLYKPLGVAWTVKSQQELDACREDFDLFIFEGFLPR